MQDSKKFAFDVGITLSASTVTMLVSFIITLILGRNLGADDLGLYKMTLTIYGIAMIIATLGVPSALIKHVAEYKNNQIKLNQYVSSGIITSFLFGIGFSLLFYFSSGLFSEIFKMQGLSSLIKLLSPIFPFALVDGALLGFLNGIREMKKHAMGAITRNVLMIVITVALIYYGFGVAGAVIGLVLSSIGNFLFLMFLTKKYFKISFFEYFQTTKKILSFGWKLLANNVINQINYRIDILFIGGFLTSTHVGYYVVAVSLSRFLWIVPDAIQRITYPATSEYWANNSYSSLQRMVDKSMKYTACILLPIGLGIGFFSKGIILKMFGGEFTNSVLPLQILILGAVFFGICSKPIGSSLAGANRPDLTLKTTSSGAIINIILNVILIPYFGIIGAAIATTLSLIIMSLIFIGLTIMTLSIKLDIKWFVKVVSITFIALLSFILGNSFINSYIFGFLVIVIYLLFLYKFFLTSKDIIFFKSLIPLLKTK